MHDTAQATARMSLAATGFPVPMPFSTVVPWRIRALGAVLGRDWRENREAEIIRSMGNLRRLDTRAPLETALSPFVQQVWAPPMTVTADRLGAGDVIDYDDRTLTIVGIELGRVNCRVLTLEVPDYELVLPRDRVTTVVGHVCQL
jgi:hypothetical protein